VGTRRRAGLAWRGGGTRTLDVQRSRHCLPVRPGTLCAASQQIPTNQTEKNGSGSGR
jgi:hypothetical protein